MANPARIMGLAMALAAAAAAQEAHPLRLMLPETVYAVPGVECNIYFDNIVLAIDPGDYVFDVTCEKGTQQQERWTYTPGGDDGGAFPLAVTVYNDANVAVAHAETTVTVAPRDAGAGGSVKALVVGDSLTHAWVYTQRLLDQFGTDGNPAFELIGTVALPDNPRNRHEGYGGWTAAIFATRYNDIARAGHLTRDGSPFLFSNADGTAALDFTRYYAFTNRGEAPDFVTFFLGCNDTFSANDESIEGVIDGMLASLDALVMGVRAASPETRIGLMPPVPPSASQDAFGANYACGQTRWQYKRNQHRVVERMRATYGGRTVENIWLVPAWINLDCVNNYPAAAAPANATATVSVSRQNNGVHPSAEGYRQIGDSLYAWMKAMLAEKDL